MFERKAVYGIALALLLAVVSSFGVVVPVKAQLPTVEVINPASGDSNFRFYSNTTKVGFRFNATIWIGDVVNLFAFQIHLHIDDTLLDISRAWLPTWDPRYVFYGLPTIKGMPTLFDNDGDGSHEAVTGGDILLTSYGVTFTGRRLAFIVEFEILYEPTVQNPIILDYFNIDNFDTYLLDDTMSQILASKTNGSYEYNYVGPVHDVAVTDIDPHKIVVGLGYCTFFTATVQNQGDFPENITLTVYVNTTVISTLNLTLASKAATIREFRWNASGFTKGPYQVSAVADPVPGETDTLDNTYVNLLVSVAIPGDIAGPDGSGIPDGKVDIRDIACAAKAFGSTPIHPTWNPNADVTGVIIGLPDHQIDIRDIALIAKNFGKVDP